MKIITLFHGSYQEVKEPKYGLGKTGNDYGQGFYCTPNLEMAKEWANRQTAGFVNRYKINIENLKILDLTKYDVLVWLAILLHHRNLDSINKLAYKEELDYLEKFYIDVSQYDLVIGYRADDAYFRFPMLFLNNGISLKTLRDIYMLGNLGTQYVLISEKAFKRIKFVNSEPVDYIYHERFLARRSSAEMRFESLRLKDKYTKEERLIDLLRKDD